MGSGLHTPTPSEIPERIVDVCRKLRVAGYEAYLVGGAVRDLLTGKSASDFDVATNATPKEVTAVFGRKRTIPTGEKHGTVTVLLESAATDTSAPHVEVTSYRGEGAYSDGRRPDEVAFVRTIEEDLKRRDFTVNAIAYDPLSDKLVDPYEGRRDLERGLLRAVGEPLERFMEDGLRAMRAVRFCAQHGFALDQATEVAIPKAIAVFRKVSAERIRDELIKILLSEAPSRGLELMRTTGLLQEVIPELLEGVGLHQNRYHKHDVWEHTLAVMDATEPSAAWGPAWLVRAAALFHDIAKPRTAEIKVVPGENPEGPPEHSFYRHEYVGADMVDNIARRLKFSTEERERLKNLVLNHMFWYSAEWTDGTVRRFISRVGKESLDDLFALRAGDVIGRGRGEDPQSELGELRVRIDEQIASQAALKVTDLAIGGGDVMRITGRPPSRLIGDVLKRLLERVLDDASINDAGKLTALVPEIVADLERV